MLGKELKVGIGDMKFAKGDTTVITYALGSCVGITFYDPVARMGALLHVLLPTRSNPADINVYKYADPGIQETIRKLTMSGMMKSRMIVKIAGGAKMFELSGKSDFGNIGQRNVDTVKRILAAQGLRISAEDTGGNFARTMVLDVATGTVVIRGAGRKEKIL
ncbi:MAG: chemotaxis protein CheD [Lachnospiraceae bacterium]|nr:chemotaxis protein CheD [Lachnospiraceae bacterium]